MFIKTRNNKINNFPYLYIKHNNVFGHVGFQIHLFTLNHDELPTDTK